MCTGQSPLTLKVIGGIVGMAQNEKALDKLFIIAPELSKLLHEFAADCVRQCRKEKITQHHDITSFLE